MANIKHAPCALLAASLIIAGCASSPEREIARQETEAVIASILSEPLDPEVYGEARRCLADREYRNFRALDDRRMLFEGRGDQLWLNTLRSRCPDLQHHSVLVVRSFSARRMCDMDTFQATDWFDWPWYRRWPWRWGSSWGMGMRCTLGTFQPVTESQVAEIEAALDQ